MVNVSAVASVTVLLVSKMYFLPLMVTEDWSAGRRAAPRVSFWLNSSWPTER